MTKKIINGVIQNKLKIGDAIVNSTGLLKKGWMVPYIEFKPTRITVHETDMPNFTAKEIYTSLKNGQTDTTRKRASFQLVVDDKEIIQCVNLNRTCWHAGEKTGNDTSIGIEICQFNDKKRQEKAYLNAAKLIQVILDEMSITKKIVQHNYWSGKNCPSKLRAKWNGYSWDWFTNLVYSKNRFKQLENGNYDKEAKVVSGTLNVRETRPNGSQLGEFKFKLKEGDIVQLGYVKEGWASIWFEGDFGYINTSNKYIELV